MLRHSLKTYCFRRNRVHDNETNFFKTDYCIQSDCMLTPLFIFKNAYLELCFMTF